MKAKDFDRKFDRGESVLSQLDLAKANRDPIVERTRLVRERLLAQFDGDLGKYVDHLIEEQAQDRDRLVTKEEVLRRKHEAKEE